MKIVHSGGVTTLVALMATDRTMTAQPIAEPDGAAVPSQARTVSRPLPGTPDRARAALLSGSRRLCGTRSYRTPAII
jgi:hypothetical protein